MFEEQPEVQRGWSAGGRRRGEDGRWREKLMAQTRWGQQGMRNNGFWTSLKVDSTGFAVAMREGLKEGGVKWDFKVSRRPNGQAAGGEGTLG